MSDEEIIIWEDFDGYEPLKTCSRYPLFLSKTSHKPTARDATSATHPEVITVSEHIENTANDEVQKAPEVGDRSANVSEELDPWWSHELTLIREDSIKKRKKYQKKRAQGKQRQAEKLLVEVKKARSLFKRTFAAKKQEWIAKLGDKLPKDWKNSTHQHKDDAGPDK